MWSGLFKSKEEDSQTSTQADEIGTLTLEIMSAILTRNTDIIGRMDPYV